MIRPTRAGPSRRSRRNARTAAASTAGSVIDMAICGRAEPTSRLVSGQVEALSSEQLGVAPTFAGQ
jgi:hypothetical protein